MPIQINTEKIIVKGKKYRRILLPLCGVLEKKDLPLEYLNSSEPAFIWNDSFDTNFYLGGEYILLLCAINNRPLLEARTYEEYEFQRILSYIRKAGENLQKINKKLKLEKWKGQEKFVI